MRLRANVALISLAVAACTSAGGTTTTDGEPMSGAPSVPLPTATTVPPTTTTTQAAPTVVRGRVIGPDRQPVEGARVASADAATTTSSDGLFELETIHSAQISVSKPGWTETVQALGEGFTHISIEPRRIRALRVGAAAASDDAAFEDLLFLADESAVNAFVFDTKQEGGKVVYSTTVGEANEMGAVEAFYDPRRRLEQARDHGLYAITRIVVFEDSYRVAARPEEKLAGGWVDPRAETAWQYNIALAEEACDLGFDEIQFDYVRFPSGRTAAVSGQLDLAEAERVAAIEGFLSDARDRLIPKGCSLSADVFAIVVSVENDQGLGQRPEELSRQLDALSPMVYPSHYSSGWLGFPDPNDHPYEVTADAIDDAIPRLDAGTVLRPWLQAFWWTNSQIRSSIQAAEDRGVGWILWNARSNFDLEALPADDEVSD